MRGGPRGPDQHEAAHEIGMLEREEQGGPAAHAVPDDVRFFQAQEIQKAGQIVRELLDGVGAGRLVGGAVAPVVVGDHLEAALERLRGAPPDVGAGGEPVGEDQGRTLPLDPVAEVDAVDRRDGHERSSRECAPVGEGAG